MELRKRSHFLSMMIILIIVLLLSAILCTLWGSANVSLIDTVKFIVSKLVPSYKPDVPGYMNSIIWELRIPRIILGIAVGGGLAICGVAIQSLTRNVLADPYILGVSSGASALATFTLVIGWEVIGLDSVGVHVAAFIGALLSLVLVYAISQSSRQTTSNRLLLAGIAISMMLNAVTQFIIQCAPNTSKVRTAMFWMMGSLGGARWHTVGLPLLTSMICAVILMVVSRQMNLMSLGDETAVTMGVNVSRLRKTLLIVVSLVTGVMVASSGAIGFVGLMIPHIVRFLIGSDHRYVLPTSFFAGAIFLIWMDVGARVIMAPSEISIGILTAFCGGPFFIWLLRRNRS